MAIRLLDDGTPRRLGPTPRRMISNDRCSHPPTCVCASAAAVRTAGPARSARRGVSWGAGATRRGVRATRWARVLWWHDDPAVSPVNHPGCGPPVGGWIQQMHSQPSHTHVCHILDCFFIYIERDMCVHTCIYIDIYAGGASLQVGWRIKPVMGSAKLGPVFCRGCLRGHSGHSLSWPSGTHALR